MFLAKEGLNPKSSSEENAVIVINIDQIPTISVGIFLKIKGSKITEDPILKKVAP